MLKYTIIGSGSRLYKKIKREQLIHQELRTNEGLTNAATLNDESVKIIFSLLNAEQIKKIRSKYTGTILIVGSCSGISRIANRFKYSRLKKHQLDYVLNSNDDNLKYLIFGDFDTENKRDGKYYVSDIGSFWEFCKTAAESNEKIFKFFKIVGKESKIQKINNIIEFLLAPVSSLFIKILTKRVYGYSNASLISKKYEF